MGSGVAGRAERRAGLDATSRRVGAGEPGGNPCMTCADPDGAAWRILSLLDGLALQTVAHPGAVDRESVVSWSMSLAEHELGLPTGSLGR